MNLKLGIKNRLVLVISLLIVIVVSGISTAIYLNYHKELDSNLKDLSSRTINLMKEEILSWVNPKSQNVEVMRRAIRANPATPPEGFIPLYREVLKSDDDVSEVYFCTAKPVVKGGKWVDASGAEYLRAMTSIPVPGGTSHGPHLISSSPIPTGRLPITKLLSLWYAGLTCPMEESLVL